MQLFGIELNSNTTTDLYMQYSFQDIEIETALESIDYINNQLGLEDFKEKIKNTYNNVLVFLKKIMEKIKKFIENIVHRFSVIHPKNIQKLKLKITETLKIYDEIKLKKIDIKKAKKNFNIHPIFIDGETWNRLSLLKISLIDSSNIDFSFELIDNKIKINSRKNMKVDDIIYVCLDILKKSIVTKDEDLAKDFNNGLGTDLLNTFKTRTGEFEELFINSLFRDFKINLTVNLSGEKDEVIQNIITICEKTLKIILEMLDVLEFFDIKKEFDSLKNNIDKIIGDMDKLMNSKEENAVEYKNKQEFIKVCTNVNSLFTLISTERIKVWTDVFTLGSIIEKMSRANAKRLNNCISK